MLDESILSELPDEAELAFPLYEAHVKAVLVDEGYGGSAWTLEYCRYIQAFLDEYDYFFEGLPKEKIDSENYNVHGRKLIDAVATKVRALRIRRARQLKADIAPAYVLQPAQKLEIYHHVEAIREIIAQANISLQKRDALANRLNAFVAEVDRDRTRLDALTAMYVFAKREAKEELKPLLSKIEKVYDIFAKASEYLGLPNSEDAKRLPSPTKQLEGPKQDDPEASDDNIQH